MCFKSCWCNYNNNGNNTTRNWIILLNIISIKKGITQHNLDWGVAFAFFKEIQALDWLNFVTGADLLWLVSPRIQQPNKCCMVRTTSAQSIQAQNSTWKNTLPCQESLYFFFVCIVCISNFDTSTLHLPLALLSIPISETIHFSPLITTIKKNKIVSLLFNVGLTIFTNSSSFIFIPISLYLCYNIYSF